VPSRHGHARRQDTPGRGSGGPPSRAGGAMVVWEPWLEPAARVPPARPAHLGIARSIERLRPGVKRRRTAVRRSPLRRGSCSAECGGEMPEPKKRLIVVGDRVLIQAEEGEDRTKVGLYLPQTAMDNQAVQGGKVIATGPGNAVSA